MNFQQESVQTVNTIFNYIEKSQNERIITSLVGYQQKINHNLLELDTQEDDIQIKEIYLQKLQKLLQFAKNPANLKQVYKYLSFNIYSQQDQFMELIQQFPNLIQQHTQQNILTLSSFIGQSCAELFSHQLITFQIKLQHDESKFKENIEQEDFVGCITYVSPEVQNQKLFKIVMKLKGFTSKVKKLDELINNGNLDSELLKFTFDNKNQKVTCWSADEQVSYQITTKQTLKDQPIFDQRIYLQTNMIIQLTKNFQLKVNGYGNGNGNQQKQEKINEHFTPQIIGNEQINVKPILQTDNLKWISINNGFEDVIYYTTEIPLKLSEYQTLPKGFEILLQNDGFGYYIIVVGDCSAFYPRIKCKKSQGQLVQLTTSQNNFNLGIIYLDNIRLLLNSNLLPIWNGTEMFDL